MIMSIAGIAPAWLIACLIVGVYHDEAETSVALDSVHNMVTSDHQCCQQP